MTDELTIALAQLNPVVGAIGRNVDRLVAACREAVGRGADLVVGSELAVSGYPPEDLVLKPFFVETVRQEVERLARAVEDTGAGLIVGTPWPQDGKVYNAAVLLTEGRIAATSLKHQLPNYGVFDEKRVFAAGPLPMPIEFRGVRLGVPVCEDIWTPEVVASLAEAGAEILLVPNGSPFEVDKASVRIDLADRRVHETGLPLAYVNQTGGQDELVFDGASFVLGADRAVAAVLPAFEEHVGLTRWRRNSGGRWVCESGPMAPAPDGLDSLYCAMMVGVRDYVDKNGFPGVIIGLSGGIDSALTAAVAVDALGRDRVHCVMMPSPYTSEASLEDARTAAGLLGVRYDTIGIEPAMRAFEAMLGPRFEGLPADITEENIQSRARGITLMALSNKFGHMLLTTGNKSEVSVGYATLYGDMAGGFSVLKDVYKTTVFDLARWRNQARPDGARGPGGRVIPERIISKPPSAELKPDQRDEDSLPPYEVLDDILSCLIEQEMGARDIVARGHDPETVNRVWRMLDRAEYKRRQAPPGVKLTRRSFGRDRRYPITNAFTSVI